MGKEKKPDIPTEVPEPEQKPEVERPVHPDDPGAPNVKPEIIPEEEMLQMPFDAAAPMEKTVVGIPAKGVYVSYTDMLKNPPLSYRYTC